MLDEEALLINRPKLNLLSLDVIRLRIDVAHSGADRREVWTGPQSDHSFRLGNNTNHMYFGGKKVMK